MTSPRGLASLVLVALPALAFSQASVSGKVRDATERPIPFCNVFIQKDGQLKELTQTDDQGTFILLAVDSGNYVFAVTSIGYKKFEKKLAVHDRPLTVDVILDPDTVLLEQIIVHDKGAIQVRGDTVVYDASYFKTGEEVALGDLLKKLPGITVDDAGKVKYRGKDVVKLKIEDDDLLDNNYQILTKNLSADLVEQVEVLQNYSDNRLLKNIEDSEDVALNVTLKKDRKRHLFGDARLEAGTNAYDSRINLMSLTKKAKYYLLSTGNNIGSDAGGEAEELMESSGRLPGQADAEYLVPVAKPSIPVFRKDRYYFNNVLFGSLNAVFRPRKNLKVTLNGLGYRDKIDFTTGSRTEYYTPVDTVGFNELSNTTNHDRFGYLMALAEFDATSNMNVRYRGRFDVNDGSMPQQNSLNQIDVSRNLDFTAHRHDHHFSLTRKLSERSAIEFDFRFASDNRPQHMLVDGNLLADYFLPAVTTDTLAQANEFSSTLWLGQVSWFARTGLGKLAVKIGYEQVSQRLTTLLASQPQILSNNLVDNHQHKTYLEGGYAMTFGKVVITPVITVQQVSTTLSDRPASPFLFLNPKLGLKWRFSEKSRFSAVYSMGQTTSSTSQMTHNPVLNDYNMVSIRDNGFRSFTSRSLLASYELGGWISGFNLFVNLYHQENPSAFLTNTDIEPNYVVSTTNVFADRKMSSLSISMDQFIKSIKSNLKLTWRGNRAEFVTSTESEAVTTSSIGQTIEGSLRTGLPGALNVHTGASVQASSTASDLIDASNYNLLVFLDGYLNVLDRRLNLTAHWERFELASITGRPVFYFVDFNARFLLKGEKGFALLFKGRNLLDENVFAQRYVSNQSVSTTTNRLIPRYLLVGVEFRF